MMNAIDIMVKRLNNEVDEDIASFYICMSEQRIRDYLNLNETADLSKYLLSVVDLAILFYQKDKSIQNVSESYGYKSESFSEGGVSESHSAYTGADINTTYNRAIADLLAGLDTEAEICVFL